MIYRNWRAIDAHRMLRKAGPGDGITTFVGLLPSHAYRREGQFSGVDYGYHIGYIWFFANWSKESDRTSWWEYPVVEMPLVNADVASKVEWRTLQLRTLIGNLSRRVKESRPTKQRLGPPWRP